MVIRAPARTRTKLVPSPTWGRKEGKEREKERRGGRKRKDGKGEQRVVKEVKERRGERNKMSVVNRGSRWKRNTCSGRERRRIV